MKLLNRFIKKIANVLQYKKLSEEEILAFQKRNRKTTINPASGLPMVGGFDSGGNTFGYNRSSFDDYNNRQDYWRN